jgi:hypothetical protein
MAMLCIVHRSVKRRKVILRGLLPFEQLIEKA